MPLRYNRPLPSQLFINHAFDYRLKVWRGWLGVPQVHHRAALCVGVKTAIAIEARIKVFMAKVLAPRLQGFGV